MSIDTITDDDLAFLARPLHGYLTVVGPLPPQPRPVWFEATPERTAQIFSSAASPRLSRLHRDPRASLIVAAPADERERWVSIAGRITIEPDGAHALVKRLAARYWDLDTRADDLSELLAGESVRLVLHPERVRRLTF